MLLTREVVKDDAMIANKNQVLSCNSLFFVDESYKSY